MKSLIVKGTFHGKNGYDRHSREFTKELLKQGISVQLRDFEIFSHIKLPGWQRENWYDQLRDADGATVMLHFTMPPQVELTARLHHANYTMFEATRVPSKWVEHNLKHDLV